MSSENLQRILQKAHKGFAYEVLSLQIEIQEDSPSKRANKIQSISKLIQLYMLGVQILQGKADQRYKYFNNKIQNLMKKKHIVEQLHLASTGKLASKKDLQQATKAQIQQRKSDLDLQIFLNQEQFDSTKIRELMNNTQQKLKKFETRITYDLKKQDDKLQQRRKIRRMKSETGSISKFDKDNNFFQSPKQIKSNKEMDQYFKIDDKNVNNKEQINRKRSGSIEKQKEKVNNLKLRSLLV